MLNLLDCIGSNADSDINDNTEEEIFEIQESDSETESNESDNKEGIEICEFSYPSINVISKEKDLILKIVDEIDDPAIKRKYLIKFKKLVENEDNRINEEPYNIKKYSINEFKNPKPTTIDDLKYKVQKIKEEVKILQEQQATMSYNEI